jgi:hypothetical protein
MCLAIFITCSSDSITLGPANKKNGWAACCKNQRGQFLDRYNKWQVSGCGYTIINGGAKARLASAAAQAPPSSTSLILLLIVLMGILSQFCSSQFLPRLQLIRLRHWLLSPIIWQQIKKITCTQRNYAISFHDHFHNPQKNQNQRASKRKFLSGTHYRSIQSYQTSQGWSGRITLASSLKSCDSQWNYLNIMQIAAWILRFLSHWFTIIAALMPVLNHFFDQDLC